MQQYQFERIYSQMEKQLGANDYFDFIEGYMGAEIVGDEMKFSIPIGSEKISETL